MSFFDPITRQRFERFRRNRMGWCSLLKLVTISALALLGALLVGNLPFMLKVDRVTRFPVLSGFNTCRSLCLQIEAKSNYCLLS